jgi:probable F420-dependent oxidoreductase
MKFDVNIAVNRLDETLPIARAVEEYGFNGLWTTETTHNPFLPLALAATVTEKAQLGTGIAVAFARSPMTTAQIAWDLAAQSNGRFVVGLGTQVKAHVTRRFGMEWAAPAPRLKEYVESMRAIWASFQNGERLYYKGEHYQFSLMTPFFNPGPIDNPRIPVYIAGVNEVMCRTAGEVADGFHVHPFHTPTYLRDFILPNIERGAQSNGRTLADVERCCAVFVVTGSTPEEIQNNAVAVKSQIAFYASTPSYRAVMDMHGWGDLHETLYGMSKSGQWAEMWEQISDEMLAHFAVVAPVDELAAAVQARYTGLLTRVGYYHPFDPSNQEQAALWRGAVDVFGQ